MEGRKDDQGKLPWHLLPYDAIELVVDVLDHGQRKYGPRNWERGMDWDRCFSAAHRHMSAWYQGQNDDNDSHLPHLSHAICMLMFLLAYQSRRIGEDNRPATVNAPPDPDIPF